MKKKARKSAHSKSKQSPSISPKESTPKAHGWEEPEEEFSEEAQFAEPSTPSYGSWAQQEKESNQRSYDPNQFAEYSEEFNPQWSSENEPRQGYEAQRSDWKEEKEPEEGSGYGERESGYYPEKGFHREPGKKGKVFQYGERKPFERKSTGHKSVRRSENPQKGKNFAHQYQGEKPRTYSPSRAAGSAFRGVKHPHKQRGGRSVGKK